MRLIQRILLRIYGYLKDLGFVSHPLGQWIFVQTYFLYKRLVEDPFFKLAQAHPDLWKDGHVMDVGASLGYTSILFAGQLSKGYRVFSFEPESDNFAILCRNIARRHLSDRIVPQKVAVGEKEGEIDLWINRDHNSDNRIVTPEFIKRMKENAAVEKVPVISIDEFVRDRDLGSISFIKIDVQGYEYPVCLGMQQTLVTCPQAAIVFEFDPMMQRDMGFEPLAVPQFFQKKGFKLFRLGRNGKLTAIDIRQFAKSCSDAGDNYFDVLALREEFVEKVGLHAEGNGVPPVDGDFETIMAGLADGSKVK